MAFEEALKRGEELAEFGRRRSHWLSILSEDERAELERFRTWIDDRYDNETTQQVYQSCFVSAVLKLRGEKQGGLTANEDSALRLYAAYKRDGG